MYAEDRKSISVDGSLNFNKVHSLAESLNKEKIDIFCINQSASDSGAMGIEAAILQLYATWLRASNLQLLKVEIDVVDDSNEYASLCSRLYGLCALRLSENIINMRSEEIDKKIALRESARTFEAVRSERYSQAITNSYIYFLSVKAGSSKNIKSKEFLSPLYNGDKVVGYEKFIEITRSVLESILPEVKDFNSDYSFFVKHLADIVRELFSNTHRHARTDENGLLYKKNFRAVSFQVVEVDRERFLNLSSNKNPSSLRFFGSWLPKEGKSVKILEVNIVDSGPGLARRWSGNSKSNLSEEDEVGAVLKCFEKHSTTSNQVSAGGGLSNVLMDIKYLQGLFRLRSGSLVAEKAFLSKLGEAKLSRADVKYTGSFLEGTSYTLIFPIESLVERY